MALTADEILVRMMVQNQQYIQGMAQSQTATSSVDKAMKVLHDTLGKPLPKVGPTSSIRDLGADAAQAQKEVRNLQFNLPNLAAQINDIGVTAAGGMQPWLIALQQGTQLNQAFAGKSAQEIYKGMAGAVASVISPVSLLTIGLVAGSAALIQWGMSALSSEADAKVMEDRLASLADAVEKLRRADDVFSLGGTEDIIRKYGTINEQVIGLVQAQRELAQINAMKELEDTLRSIASIMDTSFYNMPFSWAFTDQALAVTELRTLLKITGDDARILYDEFVRLGEALPGSPEQVESLSRLREYFLMIHRAGGDGADEALRMANMVQEAASNSQILSMLVGALPGAFSNAADEAARIATEINKAVDAASRLAIAGINDRVMADLAVKYHDNPREYYVQRELARFDSQTDTGENAGEGNSAHVIAQRRSLVEAEARATADLIEKKKALVEADREAAKSSKRGGSAARAIAGFDDAILKETAALMAEAEVLNSLALSEDKYGLAVRAARKEAEMLQQLRNKGIPITDELRKKVEELAEGNLRAAEAAEIARERHEEFQATLSSVKSTMENAFTGLITGAHSFKDALGMVLMRLAEIAASKAFEGIWGGGGGGGLGGIMGSVLGFMGFSNASPSSRSSLSGASSVKPMSNYSTPPAPLSASGLHSIPTGQSVVNPAKAIGTVAPVVNLSMGSSIDDAGNLISVIRDEAGAVVASSSQVLVSRSVQAASRASRQSKSVMRI